MVKRNLITKLLLLCALIVGSASSAWADDVLVYTLDGTITGGTNGYADESEITQGKMTWGVVGNTTMNPWRIGGKNLTGTDRVAYSKTAMGSAISKVELEIGTITLTAVNSIKLIVASDADFSNVLQTITETSVSANSTITFSPSSSEWATGAYYKLVFNVTAGSSNSYVQLKSAKFYKNASGSDPTSVSTPQFEPDGGTFTSAQTVVISCSTVGATIHYNINSENDPTENDPTYSTPISVTISGTVIKAKAFKTDMDASSVATATYTIKPNAPTIEAEGSAITITGDEGCTFYYTTNGDAPTNASTQYTAPFTLESDCTIKAIAYDTYGNSSNVKTFTYKYMPLSPKNINSNYYVKVTDVSTLENGDAILIVCEDDKVAMSTEQKSNNRGQEAVTISEGIIDTPSQNVQKLVLVKLNEEIDGENTDVFYFYTGSGYLYAASSNSNHLKTEASPDNNNNSRATISISNGDATILFTGSNARKWLKHNGNTTNGSLFSCYGITDESMHIVQIYKEVAAPPVSASISAAGYATFSSDKNVDFSANEDLVVYTATDNGSSVTLNEVENKQVPAKTAVVLKGTEGTYEGAVIASAEELGANDLHISDGVTATSDQNIYVLANKTSNGVGFYKWAGTSSLSAGKIYLKAASSAPFLGFDADGETTGISSLTPALSQGEGVYYDLSGRRVAQPTKGLYIVNGKKVLVP